MPGYPEGSVYADHLHDALGRMSRQEVPASFLTLACVVDAPRAASMFRGLLDKNVRALAARVVTGRSVCEGAKDFGTRACTLHAGRAIDLRRPSELCSYTELKDYA